MLVFTYIFSTKHSTAGVKTLFVNMARKQPYSMPSIFNLTAMVLTQRPQCQGRVLRRQGSRFTHSTSLSWAVAIIAACR